MNVAQMQEEAKHRVYFAIGTLVVMSQQTERCLSQLLIFVIPDSRRLSLEQIRDLKDNNKKRTLGYFVTELSKRVELSPEFATILQRFLNNRNALIHNFDKVPGNELTTIDDIRQVSVFLDTLREDSMYIMHCLGGLLQHWSNQTGIGKRELEDHAKITDPRIMDKISHVANHVHHFVKHKRKPGHTEHGTKS